MILWGLRQHLETPFSHTLKTGEDPPIYKPLRQRLPIILDMELCTHVPMYTWLRANPIPSLAQKGMFMTDKKADIHIVVEESVLKAAKIRCIQEDLVLSDVITQLLREWVTNKAKLKRG
jgi:hypothetical protein